MAYRDILVFLDASADTSNRLELAVALAKEHQAHLLGVDVSSPAAFEGPSKDQAVGLQDLFEGHISQAGVEGSFRVADKKTASWKDLYAHFADLVIATQRGGGDERLSLPAVPEEVLLSAGVPVLILPPGWRPAPVGESIVIAWSPSREATRAVHDALPLLMKARRVTLFEFAPPADRTDVAIDLIAEHLRRHEVAVEPFKWPDTGDMTASSALFACLDEQEADLIVAGAYGHSRFMEGLFGGVSRDLLNNPTMPLLMSH